MFKYVKNFIIRLEDSNFRILWLEQLLFSVILGASLHSWPVFCLMFLGFSWVLNRAKGLLYMVYFLSFIWGLAAVFVGYCLSGWGWGIVSGGIFFMLGLVIHFRDLKEPLNDVNPTLENKVIELEQNWPWNRQNLN